MNVNTLETKTVRYQKYLQGLTYSERFQGLPHCDEFPTSLFKKDRSRGTLSDRHVMRCFRLTRTWIA